MDGCGGSWYNYQSSECSDEYGDDVFGHVLLDKQKDTTWRVKYSKTNTVHKWIYCYYTCFITTCVSLMAT